MSELTTDENRRCPNCDKTISVNDIHTEMNSDYSDQQVPFRITQRTMALEDVRSSAKKLKSNFLGQMESRLEAMMEDVMDTLQKTEYPERFLMMSDPAMMKDRRKASVAGKLPEKEFRSRPSPLTELMEVQHIKTIYHIFIAALILVMLHTFLTDLLDNNTIDLGFERLMWTFGPGITTLTILITMEFLALFILYPCFYLWSTHRLHYKPATRRMIDYGALATFALFLGSFIYVPGLTLLQNPLRPASGALICMEQMRLLMKMYAFVRSNVPRALSYDEEDSSDRKLKVERESVNPNGRPMHGIKEDENEDSTEIRKRLNGTVNGESIRNGETTGTNGSNNNGIENKRKTLQKRDSWISWDDEKSPCPSYSKYLYFYFAPTLIYKDKYPRTSAIRWNYVCWNFAQVFGAIIYANAVLGKYISVYFGKFGMKDHPMTITMLCNAVFSLMLPGIFGLILGFYLLLHAWHGAFAELLRFADRMFYKDWWNMSSFSDYYKTWNVIVHDFLYVYVFKDSWESGLGQKHKALPTTLVFLVSSVFHEYILAFSLQFFLPVLFVLFGGFGFALVFVKNVHGQMGNIFMWLGLMAGTGIILSAYSMEYFARLNCPPVNEVSPWDFFIPRSLSASCNAIQWSLS